MRIRLLCAAMLLCCASTLAAASQGPATRPVVAGNSVAPGVRVLRDLAYVAGGSRAQRLDLYLPEVKPVEAMPLIVFIHGGGWQSGSKDRPPVLGYVSQGFAVASVEYRFSREAAFPAQLHDVKAAVRWLRANAGEHGLDPKRIVAWGTSAGGHLAALLGTTAGVEAAEGSLGNREFGSDVQAVVNFYGPADLTIALANPTVRALLVGPAKQAVDEAKIAELSRLASPVSQASKSAAPFLIFHGEADEVVPVEQSKSLSAALVAAGAESTLILIPRTGHGGVAFRAPEHLRTIRAFLDRHLKPAAK